MSLEALDAGVPRLQLHLRQQLLRLVALSLIGPSLPTDCLAHIYIPRH